MNVTKVTAEKIYRPVAMYDLKATVWFEDDDENEFVAEYITNGSEWTLAVSKDGNSETYEDADEVVNAGYAELFNLMVDAVQLADRDID